jgi:hypothetical protein
MAFAPATIWVGSLDASNLAAGHIVRAHARFDSCLVIPPCVWVYLCGLMVDQRRDASKQRGCGPDKAAPPRHATGEIDAGSGLAAGEIIPGYARPIGWSMAKENQRARVKCSGCGMRLGMRASTCCFHVHPCLLSESLPPRGAARRDKCRRSHVSPLEALSACPAAAPARPLRPRRRIECTRDASELRCCRRSSSRPPSPGSFDDAERRRNHRHGTAGSGAGQTNSSEPRRHGLQMCPGRKISTRSSRPFF